MPMSQDGPQQHDLQPEVAARLVRGAGIRPHERVLDAGAGRGAITAALLDAGAMVTALEFDQGRVDSLHSRFAEAISSGRLEVVRADLRRFHPSFRGDWRVVANPPFNLTAEMVHRWLVDADAPIELDLVLQRETAQKLTGRDGSHTRTSALVACAGRADVAAFLRREATTPPSRVDLAVWRFRRAHETQIEDMRLVEQLLERAFAGPHTVADALRGLATAIQLRRQGTEKGWDPQAHPRTIPPLAWVPLARLLATCGKLGR